MRKTNMRRRSWLWRTLKRISTVLCVLLTALLVASNWYVLRYNGSRGKAGWHLVVSNLCLHIREAALDAQLIISYTQEITWQDYLIDLCEQRVKQLEDPTYLERITTQLDKLGNDRYREICQQQLLDDITQRLESSHNEERERVQAVQQQVRRQRDTLCLAHDQLTVPWYVGREVVLGTGESFEWLPSTQRSPNGQSICIPLWMLFLIVGIHHSFSGGLIESDLLPEIVKYVGTT